MDVSEPQCCTDDCCGPGSYCCSHANPHEHPELDHTCWHGITDTSHTCTCGYGEAHGAGDVWPNCIVDTQVQTGDNS